LYYSEVMGAFNFLMQACLLVGLLFAIPVVVYNLVAFVRPALPRPVSRRQVSGLVAASSLLSIGGAGFAYYVSLPLVLHFLSSVDVSHLHPLIAANSYLSFVLSYLGVFALIFQLPLLLLFIDHITPIPPAGLKRWRKWVVIVAFGAALILPVAPDPVSQIFLALPIVVLYQVSIWLIELTHHHRTRVVRASEARPTPQPAPATTHRPQAQVRQQPARQPKLDQPHQLPPRVLDLRPRVLDLRQHS
jgi:sec-independent protein translocase protein TatC